MNLKELTNDGWEIINKEDFEKDLPVIYLTCFACKRKKEKRYEKNKYIREVYK